MLSGHEWSLFGHHRRVTSPCPSPRSTYWLQIPYIYGIPLMTLSALLHGLTSQSIFIAKFDTFDPFGEPTPAVLKNGLGYSCIAIIFTLTLAIFALIAVAGMGYKKFAAEITTVGSCSAAISSACHHGSADPRGLQERSCAGGMYRLRQAWGCGIWLLRATGESGSLWLGRFMLGQGEIRNDCS